jgi:hypothetical protein
MVNEVKKIFWNLQKSAVNLKSVYQKNGDKFNLTTFDNGV